MRASGGRGVGSGWRLATAALGVVMACGQPKAAADERGGRIAEAVLDAEPRPRGGAGAAGGDAEPASGPVLRPYTDPVARGLSRAAGGADGRRYLERPVVLPGVIVGQVRGGAPRDTMIVPTHDLSVCRPFTESLGPSVQGGVGNAVVWLEGVAAGPKDDAPRRAKLTLDGCRLEPRVQRIAVGGTLQVHSRDAMMSRLQFIAVGESVSRATILLTDAGQVVPSSAVATPAGLVEVRDDRHPWVHGWLAVAPHPFVAVTAADGRFRFDNVPPGRYTLVVWQEQIGTRTVQVRAEAGVQTTVDVRY